jgi:hypothetical protein
MIRFVLGLLLVMGSVGGLEQDTATFTQAILGSFAGLLLMVWALPKLISQGEGYQ